MAESLPVPLRRSDVPAADGNPAAAATADQLRDLAAAALDSSVERGLIPPAADDQKLKAALIDAVVAVAGEVIASDTAAATDEEPLRSGSSASPAAAAPDAEDRHRREIALYAFSGAALLGLNNDLDNLVSSWGTPRRVVYGAVMMLAGGSLSIGLIANGKLWSICSRFTAILSSILFTHSVSCKMGRLGWVGGIATAVMTTGVMATLWAREEPAVAEAVSRFWGGVARLGRRKEEEPGHAAASSMWSRVMKLCRWGKKTAVSEEHDSLPPGKILP